MAWQKQRVKPRQTAQTFQSLYPVSSQPTTKTTTKAARREKICTIQKGWPHGEKGTYGFGGKTLQVAAMMLE